VKVYLRTTKLTTAFKPLSFNCLVRMESVWVGEGSESGD